MAAQQVVSDEGFFPRTFSIFRKIWRGFGFALLLALLFTVATRQDAGAIVSDQCFATPDNGTTVFGSTDAGAVQEAVDAASAGDTVKVAGMCFGVNSVGGAAQSVYISKTLTLAGGYTTTNWTLSDPVANPTGINATSLGRVLRIVTEAPGSNPAIDVRIENIRLVAGLSSLPGGGVSVEEANAIFSDTVVLNNTTT
ncbi:MAG: hypothetical protein HC802_13115, partial [Caldilineaceae bacterium]|nr:hypothetical protein [Caldilineaceae bacterium]